MHHLEGLTEVAARLGVSKQRVQQLIDTYDNFPKPTAVLSQGRVWETADVDAWKKKHKSRRPGRPTTKGKP